MKNFEFAGSWLDKVLTTAVVLIVELALTLSYLLPFFIYETHGNPKIFWLILAWPALWVAQSTLTTDYIDVVIYGIKDEDDITITENDEEHDSQVQ